MDFYIHSAFHFSLTLSNSSRATAAVPHSLHRQLELIYQAQHVDNSLPLNSTTRPSCSARLPPLITRVSLLNQFYISRSNLKFASKWEQCRCSWPAHPCEVANLFKSLTFSDLHLAPSSMHLKYRLHGGVKLANEKCWSKSGNPGPLSDWPKLTLYVLRLGLKNKRNPFRIDDLQKNQIFRLWAFVILMLPPNNPKFSVRIM